MAGNSLARSSRDSSVPSELIVMATARRSASKSSRSPISAAVAPPWDEHSCAKSSRYALYSVARITSMFISSKSSDEMQPEK